MTTIASTGHTRAEAEAIERAARKLLGIPRLPDGATGPGSRAILAEIQADRAKLGEAATLRKWAHVSVVAHAFALASDPAEHRAAAKVTVEDHKHPERAEYCYPAGRIAAKLSDLAARAKCSAAELAVLDSHASKAQPLPAEWSTVAAEPREGKEVER